MIRINLLGLKKEVARAAGPGISMEGAKLAVLFVVIVALGVAALGVHYVMLTTEAGRLAVELQEAEKEKARLAQVKKEVDQNEKRKQLLLKRINIIEGLKKSQVGPVNLLATVATTVGASEQLWLTSFENDGVKVNLDGVAGSVNTVADFIANLKRSGQFKSVEIKESYQDERFKDLPTFVFSITAEVAQATPAPASKT